MRYRSAVLFGRYDAITEQDAKRCALGTITDALIPGRSAEVLAIDGKETSRRGWYWRCPSRSGR
jgi:nitroimidazol reductase NimA-like FMN-containing flavoprotein (pyridoxamine 5'-phosphate oxidase superfamily)